MLGPHPSDTGMVMFLSCGRISLDLIMRMTISFGSRNRKDGLLASKRTLTVTGYARPTLVVPFILAFTLLVCVDPVLSCCQRPPSALAKKPRPHHHLPIFSPHFGFFATTVCVLAATEVAPSELSEHSRRTNLQVCPPPTSPISPILGDS